MAAKPLLGIICDKYKCHKYVFVGVVFLTGLSAIGFCFVPKLSLNNYVNMTCDSNEEYTVELTGKDVCFKEELWANKHISCYVSILKKFFSKFV